MTRRPSTRANPGDLAANGAQAHHEHGLAPEVARGDILRARLPNAATLRLGEAGKVPPEREDASDRGLRDGFGGGAGARREPYTFRQQTREHGLVHADVLELHPAKVGRSLSGREELPRAFGEDIGGEVGDVDSREFGCTQTIVGIGREGHAGERKTGVGGNARDLVSVSREGRGAEEEARHCTFTPRSLEPPALSLFASVSWESARYRLRCSS